MQSPDTVKEYVNAHLEDFKSYVKEVGFNDDFFAEKTVCEHCGEETRVEKDPYRSVILRSLYDHYQAEIQRIIQKKMEEEQKSKLDVPSTNNGNVVDLGQFKNNK